MIEIKDKSRGKISTLWLECNRKSRLLLPSFLLLAFLCCITLFFFNLLPSEGHLFFRPQTENLMWWDAFVCGWRWLKHQTMSDPPWSWFSNSSRAFPSDPGPGPWSQIHVSLNITPSVCSFPFTPSASPLPLCRSRWTKRRRTRRS